MKYLIIPFLTLTMLSNIQSQEEAVELKNKIVNNEQLHILEPIIKNDSLIPKSVYIGPLGNFNSVNINNNDFLAYINDFLGSLQNGDPNSYINENFMFIFKNRYNNILMDEYNKLEYWRIGIPEIIEDHANINVELHYKKNLYICELYLIKNNSKWLITDFQLEEKSKGFFDPSVSRY